MCNMWAEHITQIPLTEYHKTTKCIKTKTKNNPKNIDEITKKRDINQHNNRAVYVQSSYIDNKIHTQRDTHADSIATSGI